MRGTPDPALAARPFFFLSPELAPLPVRPRVQLPWKELSPGAGPESTPKHATTATAGADLMEGGVQSNGQA